MYIEWWDSETSKWELSKIPFHVFIYGRITGEIAKYGTSRAKAKFIHVPRSHIEFI